MTESRRIDELERLFAETREALDAEVTRSGAPGRVREAVIRSSADPLAGLHWQRIAAAVLVAGMLGGLVDLVLPESSADTVDVAIVDLYGFDPTGSQ